MKAYLILLLLIINISNCFGQRTKDSLYYAQEFKALQYASSLTKNMVFNRDYISIFNKLTSQTEYFKYSGYLDLIAHWYNNVGHYNKGIELGDIAFPRTPTSQLFNSEEYIVRNAIDVITEKSQQHQVVMINEEHRMSRHRVLTLELLAPLYNNGFRYLAIEALFNKDLLVNGYPILDNGTYIKDPVFGEMIRTAIDLGYKIIPYEIDFSSSEYKNERNPMKRHVFREKKQAENIISNILNKDKNAKILVHGGRGHISEVLEYQIMGKDSLEFGTMAGFFKKLSGIDPYTVDQLQHEEHSDSIYESTIAKWTRKADEKLFSSNVLVNKKNGNLIHREIYDAAIITNPSNFINKRPHWLVDLKDRNELRVNVKKYQPEDSKFFMVQAIYKDEDMDKTIPADQYAYQKEQKRVSLFLKKGVYIIRILDNNGEVLKQFEKKIN